MIVKSEPIRLVEYEKHLLPKPHISEVDGERLWNKFGSKITIEQPSFKNNQHWELTSQGYVGFIPVSEDLSLSIIPKVSIKNLFGMWEYAYRLRNIEFLEDIYQAKSLQEFYSQLANILAKRIIDRSVKGYYRAYLSKVDDLSYVKGRLDLNRLVSTPWIVRPRCSFQEHTADIEDNKILAWTLYTILRSGFCHERVLSSVRKAYRNITHTVTLQSYEANDCIGRFYTRLNQDYQPLHALSRFFLENSGPSYELGEHKMLPFLVDMAQLFEMFVAEWLKIHLPPTYYLKSQETIDINKSGNINIRIDLVLYDSATNQPHCVLDTKYKRTETPSPEDIAQVNLYASVKQCKEAILIYPENLSKPVDQVINGIRIRTITFDISGDLESGGNDFINKIITKP